jgi:hypothetical protein
MAIEDRELVACANPCEDCPVKDLPAYGRYAVYLTMSRKTNAERVLRFMDQDEQAAPRIEAAVAKIENNMCPNYQEGEE